jgi:hypothetical protein
VLGACRLCTVKNVTSRVTAYEEAPRRIRSILHPLIYQSFSVDITVLWQANPVVDPFHHLRVHPCQLSSHPSQTAVRPLTIHLPPSTLIQVSFMYIPPRLASSSIGAAISCGRPGRPIIGPSALCLCVLAFSWEEAGVGWVTHSLYTSVRPWSPLCPRSPRPFRPSRSSSPMERCRDRCN